MELTSFLLSDMGRKRKNNEDSCGEDPRHQLFVVADGMGGHAAGEVASRLAVETALQFFAKHNAECDSTWPYETDPRYDFAENKIRAAISEANRRIVDAIKESPQLETMGTTITLLHFTGGKAYAAHVGDSRIYRFRGGELTCLTSDHSWVNEQVRLGVIKAEDAKRHPFRNVITRALGAGGKGGNDQARPDVLSEVPEEGDIYLLCSDGLNGMLPDTEIARILAESDGALDRAAHALVAGANAGGGDDNITVALVRVA